MRLPDTVQGTEGLTVEGASADLLAELLGEYGSILKETSPNIWGSMAPGLSRDEIVNRAGEAGLAMHEELIVWWMWRNGHIPGIAHGLRNEQMSLDLVLALRQRDSLRPSAFRAVFPSEGWLRIAGVGSIVASADPAADAPTLRGFDPETSLSPKVTHAQAKSMCTFVTWKLVAIEQGWNRYDPESGFWKLEEWDAIPLEWRLTGIV